MFEVGGGGQLALDGESAAEEGHGIQEGVAGLFGQVFGMKDPGHPELARGLAAQRGRAGLLFVGQAGGAGLRGGIEVPGGADAEMDEAGAGKPVQGIGASGCVLARYLFCRIPLYSMGGADRVRTRMPNG